MCSLINTPGLSGYREFNSFTKGEIISLCEYSFTKGEIVSLCEYSFTKGEIVSLCEYSFTKGEIVSLCEYSLYLQISIKVFSFIYIWVCSIHIRPLDFFIVYIKKFLREDRER